MNLIHEILPTRKTIHARNKLHPAFGKLLLSTVKVTGTNKKRQWDRKTLTRITKGNIKTRLNACYKLGKAHKQYKVQV